MQLKDARQYYEDGSEAVADLVEKLNFAGIGTVLVLSGGLSADGIEVSESLLIALILFATSLGFSLAQNVTKTAVWFRFFRKAEEVREVTADGTKRHRGLDDDIGTAEPSINTVVWSFFWLRTVACVIGWVFVIDTFAGRLK